MLERALRAKREDIEEAIKNGINIPGSNFYAKVSRKTKEKTTFAIIIPKKAEKTSVGRHLIKRRIGAVIEKECGNGQISKKTIVIFAKKMEKKLSFSGIEKEIKEILKKV